MNLEIVLTALYLRGAPRSLEVRRQGWTCVERELRRASAEPGQASEVLRRAGLWTEALALEEPCLLAWATKVVERGGCLTAASEGYPERWRRVLGERAPPALWREGPPLAGPLVGLVGSREVSGDVLAFAEDAAAEAVRLGYGIVSGGAKGCDTAAAWGGERGGGSVIEILPRGLTQADASERLRLSVCAPGEPFTAGAAMERNVLLYAASEATVVAHARFKTGGTWTGATDAVRRRLCPLIVREDPLDLACRALIGLGGRPLRAPEALDAALRQEEAQRELFAV